MSEVTTGAPGGDPVRFGLFHDFRNPVQWHQPFDQLYAQVLDQIVWAESLGWGSVWLTEHHFSDDGYLPSPLTVAAAIAARTRTLRIGTSIVVLPLADPIRLAEDAAVVSVISGGRFDLGVGLGYREVEFAGYRRRLSQRVSLLEEGVAVLRRAWSGEPVEFSGRRFQIPSVRVTPVPDPPPRLLLGGVSEPAIDRAVRLGDGFACGFAATLDLYAEAMRRHDRDPASGHVCALQWAIIDEDPEKTWAAIGDHAVYVVNRYLDWGAFGPPENFPRFGHRDELVGGGMVQLWDAATATRELVTLLRARPEIKDIHFLAKLAGEPIESANRRVEYIATKVIGQVHDELRPSGAQGP